MPLPSQYASAINNNGHSIHESFAGPHDAADDPNGISGVVKRMSSSDIATLGLMGLVVALVSFAVYSMKRAARDARSYM